MTAVNPIPVVRNNAGDFIEELVKEEARLLERLHKVRNERFLCQLLLRVTELKEGDEIPTEIQNVPAPDTVTEGYKLLRGRVKWFNEAKGFGFIEGEDDNDYFVHFSQCLPDSSGYRRVEEGQQVQFVPLVKDGKLVANAVAIL